MRRDEALRAWRWALRRCAVAALRLLRAAAGGADSWALGRIVILQLGQYDDDQAVRSDDRAAR